MKITCSSCGKSWLHDKEQKILLCPCGETLHIPRPVSNADPVNRPSHYTSGPIECFDAMKSAFTKEEMIAYCKVAAFKYLWREGKKDNPIQERKKAEWYLQRSIELMEETK